MSFIAKKIGKRALGQHLAAYEPSDTLYENSSENPKKRVRRELPPGLSPKEQKTLRKLRSRAHYLDKGVNLCGLRLGWTFFLALIPFVGDAIDALLNYNLVLKKAKKELDLPDHLIATMWFNNLVSLGVSLVPFVGDIVLGIWKANSRNVHLVEEYLALRAQQNPYQPEGVYGSTSHSGQQTPTRTQPQIAAQQGAAPKQAPVLPERK